MNRIFILTTAVLMSFCVHISAYSGHGQAKSLHSDSIDVLHYEIHLDITNIAGQTISGYTELEIVPKISGLNIIALDLLKLTVDSIKYAGSVICTFTHNDTLLRVQLPQIVSPIDTFFLKVFYHGHPIKDPSGWGGFYFSSGYAFNLGVGFADKPQPISHITMEGCGILVLMILLTERYMIVI
ncbi:MAG: hypothetical protein HY738_19505 [Bacteroidia bacterium]|nr:hypothetical protein [Bacteroidia bacterium]